MSSNSSSDRESEQFDLFLQDWSRRDVLRGMGGALAFTAFLAGGMELLAACGGGGTTTTTQNVVKGGHLVEGSISDIANLNPIFSNDTASNTVRDMIYDRLLTVDAAGNLLPNIATEVPKVDSDQVTYKFKLRNDVKWSDGQQFTADDVVFTFQLMFDPKYKAVTSRYRSQLEQYLASATAPDKTTVVFKTTSAYAPFLISFGTLPILPKHVWETLQPAAMNSSEMNQVPTVGSGPFLPVKWDKGAQYQLKRNDTYFRGKANLDSFIYKVVPDAVQVANQLKTGELDVGQPDASVWDSLATAQTINRVSYVGPSFAYYIQNLDPAKTPKAAIFGDLQVRKALLTALDLTKVADKVYFGQAAPADSSVSSAQWVHSTPKTQYHFSLSNAEKMLDAAGWVKGADGIRAKGGVRMEWELRTNSGNKVRETLITVLADQWKQIGANVATKAVQFPQLVTQLSQTREFEMILLGISEGLDPDTTQLWHSKSIGNGALNGMGYKNPRVDDLLDQAVKTLDREKRKGLYQQVQEILMEDLPAPLLTFPKSLWGVSKRVKNFNVGAWNTSSPRPWFKDVYVTDGK
ncbi:MAG TPA: ABC transporter substrate-binding protein [Candidatus Dormibacteraeota bacterium]|nr:ABC transporter substrate-binding protein [Candidatus Dormibacteraeota bacterium]